MKKIGLLILILNISALYAQNDILLNQYMLNEFSFNPAVAGFKPSIETQIIARQQWFGYNEAPSSQNFNINGYKRNIGGIGLNISNDKLGKEGAIDVKLAYAHYIQISPKSLLSFGLAAGFISKTIKGAELIYADPDDEKAFIHTETRFKPDFNIGMEFNSTYVTLGLASTHIHQALKSANNFQIPRHYYAYGKFRIEVSDKVNIVPTFLIKSSSFITQYDINTLFYYDNKFWLGASYRINEAYVGLIGFQINKNIKFGYAYDVTIGPATLYNMGSHEVLLSYGIPTNLKRQITSPRFFN